MTTSLLSFEQIDRRARRIIEQGSGSICRQVVETAFEVLGSEADLQQIYTLIELRRPTPNPFGREKLRQVCELYFVRPGPGTYLLNAT